MCSASRRLFPLLCFAPQQLLLLGRQYSAVTRLCACFSRRMNEPLRLSCQHICMVAADWLLRSLRASPGHVVGRSILSITRAGSRRQRDAGEGQIVKYKGKSNKSGPNRTAESPLWRPSKRCQYTSLKGILYYTSTNLVIHHTCARTYWWCSGVLMTNYTVRPHRAHSK